MKDGWNKFSSSCNNSHMVQFKYTQHVLDPQGNKSLYCFVFTDIEFNHESYLRACNILEKDNLEHTQWRRLCRFATAILWQASVNKNFCTNEITALIRSIEI